MSERLLRGALAAAMVFALIASGSAMAKPVVPGGYMSRPYAEAVERTHSPLAALNATRGGGIPQVALFSQCFGDVPDCLSFIQDFAKPAGDCPYGEAAPKGPDVKWRHAGDRAFCEGPGRGVTEADRGHFLLPLPSSANATRFRWVLNVDRFATLQTVSGVWKDAQGRTWRFSHEEGATIPGIAEPLTFHVRLNTTGHTIDELVFQTSDPGALKIPGVAFSPDVNDAVVGFVREDKKLTLYPMAFPKDAAIPVPDRAHPVAVLNFVSALEDPVPEARLP